MLPQWELVLRLLLAGFLGAIVGIERMSHHKEAGLRTRFVMAISLMEVEIYVRNMRKEVKPEQFTQALRH